MLLDTIPTPCNLVHDAFYDMLGYSVIEEMLSHAVFLYVSIQNV